MLQKVKSKQLWKLKYLFLIPVIGAMLLYSSCQNEASAIVADAIEVGDIENLTEAEEANLFASLTHLSDSSDDWQLLVKDQNSSMKFVKSYDESYLSGLDGEKIKAKLAIDNSLIAINPMSKSSVESISDQQSSWAERYNKLNTERNTLLKNYPKESNVFLEINKKFKALIIEAKGENPSHLEFFFLDEAPIFPGCENTLDNRQCFEESFQRHIKKHLKYPKESLEKEIEGTVNGTLIIENDGTIRNGGTEGPNSEMRSEVERIIQRLPKMHPGKFNGKEVAVVYSYHIPFKLP